MGASISKLALAKIVFAGTPIKEGKTIFAHIKAG